jgi:hypothetical protein
MSQSKKNDDDSDAVLSSPKKTAEELFQLAANATLPARKRIQPNIYGSTPSPPPLPKPTTSKKNGPLCILVVLIKVIISHRRKEDGRLLKTTLSVPVPTTVTINVPPPPPQSILDYEWYVPWFSLFVSVFYMCRAYRSSILISVLFHPSHFNSILPHFLICKKKLHPLLILLSPP